MNLINLNSHLTKIHVQPVWIVLDLCMFLLVVEIRVVIIPPTVKSVLFSMDVFRGGEKNLNKNFLKCVVFVT